MSSEAGSTSPARRLRYVAATILCLAMPTSLIPILGLFETARGARYEMTWWIVPNTILFIVVAVVVVTLHELGHAIAAWATRIHVREIWIGAGPPLFSVTFGELKVSLRPFVFEGRTLLSTTNSSRLRARLWVATLAGPLMSLGTGLVVWLMFPQKFGVALLGGFAPTALFIIVSVLLSIANLLPLKMWSMNGRINSDGLQLLRLPTSPDSDFDSMFRLGFARELKRTTARPDIPAAIDCARRALSRFPNDFQLTLLLATCLNKEDSGEEKWQLVRSLVAREAPSPAVRARLLNTWAWECYERGDRSLLGEADDASREALKLIPDDASLLDTRGHVLVWAGRHAEARAPLLRALELASNPEARAYAASGLSLASASAGDRVDAERWLTKARELSPTLPFLERVAKRLSEPTDALAGTEAGRI